MEILGLICGQRGDTGLDNVSEIRTVMEDCDERGVVELVHRPGEVKTLNPALPPGLHELEEILKIKALAIKKEEIEIQAEIDQLQQECQLHMRETKRIQAEDDSRSGQAQD